MASLLDVISKNNVTKKPGMQDNTLQAQTLLAARSGKAGAGTGDLATSQVSEQAVNDQAGQQVSALNQTAGVQQQALRQADSQQKQSLDIQKQGIQQQSRFNALENQLKTNELLQNLEQNRGKLDVTREGAAKEQLASNLRLQNQKYTDQLQREGTRARLDDELEFKKALEESVLGHKKSLLEGQLQVNSIMDLSDREFKKRLNQIDMDTAQSLFDQNQKAQQAAAIWSSIAALGAGGASFAASNKSKKSETNSSGSGGE